MDHSYIDIHALIREANKQRSEAMGEILSTAWRSFTKFLATQLGRPETPRTPHLTTPSKLVGMHH
jgi:hypothetical protein